MTCKLPRSRRKSTFARADFSTAAEITETDPDKVVVERLSVPENPTEQKTNPTRWPVVFCHGLMGFDRLRLGAWEWAYWRGIVEELRDTGCEVYVMRVPPAATIEARALKLRESIRETVTAKKMNIIAHSMGGLDARYLISRLDGYENVASLTTLATPHHGSSFANWCLQRRLEDVVKGLRLLEVGAVSNLTTDFLSEVFNPSTPDHPDVKYFSYGAAVEPVTRLSPLWRFSGQIIYELEGPNDGLVSTKSAHWGEYQRTLECDHLQMINWRVTNWNSDYKGLELYREIYANLLSHNL